MVFQPPPAQPRRPIVPTDDELAAAAEALRDFAREDAVITPKRATVTSCTVEPVVSATVSSAPREPVDPWGKLTAEFEAVDAAGVDFSFLNRGPLSLNEIDIPPDLEPFWCRVVLANGEADTFSVADAKRRHFKPVPRDMIPDLAFSDEQTKHLTGWLEGGFVRGGYCLMVRPRKITAMEAKINHDAARQQLAACLSQFERNVTIEGLMQSRAPEMTFTNFRGRKAVVDD